MKLFALISTLTFLIASAAGQTTTTAAPDLSSTDIGSGISETLSSLSSAIESSLSSALESASSALASSSTSSSSATSPQSTSTGTSTASGANPTSTSGAGTLAEGSRGAAIGVLAGILAAGLA